MAPVRRDSGITQPTPGVLFRKLAGSSSQGSTKKGDMLLGWAVDKKTTGTQPGVSDRPKEALITKKKARLWAGFFVGGGKTTIRWPFSDLVRLVSPPPRQSQAGKW